MKERIMVALSGGVDSAVAAYILKEQGYEVVGVTMCLGVTMQDTGKVKCCGPKEIDDARAVCRSLSIDHYVLDFALELQRFVIDPFIEEYSAGRTPNPCVECNRHIKFGSLLDKALSMGFSYLATGHYAGIGKTEKGYRLIMPKDSRKDQTYFLSGIPRQSLSKVLFPLADLTKDQVRQIADREKLPVSAKPESQDICFIPKGNTEEYLKEHVSSPSGDIVDQKCNVIGAHGGIALYTIGQRAHLNMNWGKPFYVIAKDIERNIITIGGRENLLARGLMANSVNLFTESLPGKAYAKIRYAHTPAHCRVTIENDRMMVMFYDPQEAVTPGQTVALYADGAVLASGIISEAIG